jgi:hypothetical protein
MSRRSLALCIAALVTMLFGTSEASEKPHDAKVPPAKKAAPGSLVVHIEPKSMRISLKPGEGTIALELTADVLTALSTSSEGLKSTTKDGVTRVDLEGRFHPVWIAVVDAEGRHHPVCLTSLPPDVEEAARAVRSGAGGPK